MADITIVNGVYKPTYNWGHHPVAHVHSVTDILPHGEMSIDVLHSTHGLHCPLRIASRIREPPRNIILVATGK
jgi:hypothetical protein